MKKNLRIFPIKINKDAEPSKVTIITHIKNEYYDYKTYKTKNTKAIEQEISRVSYYDEDVDIDLYIATSLDNLQETIILRPKVLSSMPLKKYWHMYMTFIKNNGEYLFIGEVGYRYTGLCTIDAAFYSLARERALQACNPSTTFKFSELVDMLRVHENRDIVSWTETWDEARKAEVKEIGKNRVNRSAR